MTIREAEKSDVFGILEVLKSSLGEQSSKKNLEVWNYKHTENPFGSSLVLIAENDGKIVGVRAFMRWEWRNQDRTFKTYRAVDTATHPDYQGKGIFKKLTLKALSFAEDEGGDFVFNTPNSQSKPGYLKMDWQEIGDLNVKLVPLFSTLFSNSSHEYEQKLKWTGEGSKHLLNNLNSKLQEKNELFTPKSKQFLEWRYINCPLQKYRVNAFDNYFLAGYIKKHSNLKELRISELITGDVEPKFLKKVILNWAREHGAHIISFSKSVNLSFFPTFYGDFGPTFTVRTIQKDEVKKFNLEQFNNVGNWHYSLGDLELF